ncbi:hypothetical protein ACFFRR_002118 [Megaselia abdita]
MDQRVSSDCVKKLNFEENREAETKEQKNPYPNLVQRSWSSTDFPSSKEDNKLQSRSKSVSKLHQYDYSLVYKRKREEKVKRMEDEIRAQANSFKSRPMPNFMNKKQPNFPLKITVPITPEVLKRTKETGTLRKQKFSEWEAKLEAAKDQESSASYKENMEMMEPDSTCDLDE